MPERGNARHGRERRLLCTCLEAEDLEYGRRLYEIIDEVEDIGSGEKAVTAKPQEAEGPVTDISFC